MGLLEPGIAQAIEDASRNVAQGSYDDHFPVDVFQTGSGTSTNMNANEVIANLASRAAGVMVHPNDHVNMGQSSNDVIPSAIHLSAYEEIHTRLLPALELLEDTIGSKARAFDHVVKTGRTHLMDAVPLRMDQELSGWQGQITDSKARIEATLPRLAQIGFGRNRGWDRREYPPGIRPARRRETRRSDGTADQIFTKLLHQHQQPGHGCGIERSTQSDAPLR